MNIEKVLLMKEQDVLDYLIKHKLDRKCRKREIIDPRNFLINVLYHRFDWAEQDIADFFYMSDRSTIWHAKNQAYYNWENQEFLDNTKKVRLIFPHWIPPKPESDYQFGRKIPITIQFTKQEYDRLNKARNKMNNRNFSVTAKKIILDNISNYE